jgi:alpha-N-arabinofuranosidase
VVRIAAIAQLVNVIAPIMTEPGGPAWRQTIYYPYYFASRYGRGRALNLALDCPGYDSEHDDNVPFVDIAGVHDEEAATATFFTINRHPTDALPLDLSLLGFGPAELIDHQVMTHASLRAVNTLTDQTQVAPRKGTGARVDGTTLTASLPPHSWQMIRLRFGPAGG